MREAGSVIGGIVGLALGAFIGKFLANLIFPYGLKSKIFEFFEERPQTLAGWAHPIFVVVFGIAGAIALAILAASLFDQLGLSSSLKRKSRSQQDEEEAIENSDEDYNSTESSSDDLTF